MVAIESHSTPWQGHPHAKRYGSYNEASGYDRRTVYVVDVGGRIAYMDLSYSARDTA